MALALVPFEFRSNVGVPPVVVTVTGALMNLTVMGITDPGDRGFRCRGYGDHGGHGQAIAICCVARPSVPVAGRVSVALVAGTSLSTMVPPLSANAVVEV